MPEPELLRSSFPVRRAGNKGAEINFANGRLAMSDSQLTTIARLADRLTGLKERL
jgi:hypothetical protein